MDSPYARELRVAADALRQAALLAQSIIDESDKGVVQKTDQDKLVSPVTAADFAVQALLSATVRAHFPDDGLVGEEGADELRESPALMDKVWGLVQGVEDRAAGGERLWRVPRDREEMCALMDACGKGQPGVGRMWVFDPIDGTRGFMRGELYAVNMALLEDGNQILSAVAAPGLDPDVSGCILNETVDPTGRGSLLFAVRGHGAYIRPLHTDDAPRRLRPQPAEPTMEDLRLVTSTTTGGSCSLPFHEAVAASLGVTYPGCDLLPWVIRWAALAMGLGNTTVWVYDSTSRRGKVWDHAGAMLLFEETGGKISDVLGREIDFRAGRRMVGNFGFVAGPEGVHGEVLARVRGVMREFGRGDELDG